MAQVTRLGVIGIPRPPYGSFAGKTETIPAQDITATDDIQLPIDYIMADNPPVIPVLTNRPGRPQGPRLVEKVHLSQGPMMSPKPQARLRGPRLVERIHVKT